MPTPDELRANIDTAREVFRSALQGAGANWEKAPASGEGEAAWSPRQAAEHTIGTEVFLAKAICDACGYPGPEPIQPSLATADEAVAAFEEAVKTSNSKIKYVSAEDLTKTHERFGNVEGLMALAASHLEDHAQQIASASA